jgi:hypothetical protein
VRIIITLCLMLFSSIVVVQAQSAEADNKAAQGLEAQIELFLLSAAAEDFSRNKAMQPSAFRNLRIGHIVTNSKEKQYLLCGQFLLLPREEQEEWVNFATIKTDPYEQWIGGQSEGLCQRSLMIWESHDDLTSKLLDKVHAAK